MLFLVGLFFFLSPAWSAPNGASQCVTGGPSVAGNHLSANSLTTGTLDQGGYTVSIPGYGAFAEGNSIVVQGGDFDIVVGGALLRGFLIRAAGTTADQGSPIGIEAKNAAVCGNLASVTHSSNNQKTDVGISLSGLDPGTHDFDIDVVVRNSIANSESTYYYQTFTVTVEEENLLQVASHQDDLQTFVQAVALASPVNLATRMYTVFAPTDIALQNLETKYLADPQWEAHLEYLLSFHILQGTTFKADIVNGTQRTSIIASAGSLLFNVMNGEVLISGDAFADSMIVEADLSASNGVLHKVDQYFLPQALTVDLFDLAAGLPGFSAIATLIVAVGREDTLRADERTIFFPDANAFSSYPVNIIEVATENPELFAGFLDAHVAQGIYHRDRLTDELEITNIAGAIITVNVTLDFGIFSQRELFINSGTFANIVTYNVLGSNGVVHIIDNILLDNIEDFLPSPSESPSMAPSQPTTTRVPPKKVPFDDEDDDFKFYDQGFKRGGITRG